MTLDELRREKERIEREILQAETDEHNKRREAVREKNRCFNRGGQTKYSQIVASRAKYL